MACPPCPRRPILAAVCTVLLLATVVLWLHSQWYLDRVYVDVAHATCRVGTIDGQLWVGVGATHWTHAALGFPQVASTYTGPSPFRLKPGWFTWAGPAELGGGWNVGIPLWLVAAVSGAGLWWSWRRRRNAGAGFPVEVEAKGGRESAVG